MNLVLKHRWDVSLDEAIGIQKRLSQYVIKKDVFEKVERIVGLGITFPKDAKIVTAVVVFSFPELRVLKKIRKEGFSTFSYKSGFFAFCAGTFIISCLKEVEKTDLLIFPGKGILHPRGLGLASHLGVLFDIPTIACSRTPLLRNFKEPKKKKGSFLFIEQKGERVGAVLRSRDNAKPIFVTPGHRISCESSVEIILKCCTKFRLPEPLRKARILAKEFIEKRKGE